jgi:O-antigen/teichoic acid export membrane protein
MALSSPLLARLMQLDSILPVLAASFSLLLLFLRPVTDGTLQGLQRFGGLGSVQVLQALLRLLIAASLILLGLKAFGALLALPLASSVALILALLLLRPSLSNSDEGEQAQQVSLVYSVQTLVGLLAFALLVNMDAILVKVAFDPQTAGNYAPVVTLGKINAFISFAIAIVLFPKTTQRQMTGRDTRPILSIALLAVIIPGLLLTGVYLVAPGGLVNFLFGEAYQDPGLVLGLVGLATTLYGALYIWLNYGLSLERSAIIYIMVAIAIFQVIGFLFFHATLLSIATVMLVTSMIGNIAAAASTRVLAVN